jgi:dihydroorotase
VQTLTITRPDDFHLHLRDGAVMSSVVRDSASQFGRAIIMPNLTKPVVSIQHAKAYRERIIAALPDDSRFEPLMTLYLTDNTTCSEIETAIQNKIIYAIKYYPSGSTTNSENGVTNIENIFPLLECMIEHDFPLLVHGETTAPDVDIFDREAVFIDTTLLPLVKRYDQLRLVLEHVSTLEGINFIKAGSKNIAATITPHHLLLNRNNIFINGLRPHHYCLPVLKSEDHRQAVLEAATSGNPKFFLGTDSAPHAKYDKESACCPAGIYSAYNAMSIYAECFEQAGSLDRLEGFASHFGADFYRLPRNQDTITLVKKEWTVPETLPFGEMSLVPLRAGETCQWMLAES